MTPERATAAKSAGRAVADFRVTISVRVSSRRARELIADVGSSGAVVTGNTRKSFSAVGVEGAVESSRADGARSSGQNDCSGTRSARDGIGETSCAVVTKRARILSGVDDRLTSRAVVTSLAISIRSSQVGDSAGLASRAGLAASVQGDTTSGGIVSTRRARLRVRSAERAVVSGRADDTASAVSGSRDAGVALAPVTSRTLLHGVVGGGDRWAVEARRARRARASGSKSRIGTNCGDGARPLISVSG
jgi:hypothetical protein